MKTLKSRLQEELNKSELNHNSPNVTMYIDSSSIYWVIDDETFLFIQGHEGIEDYIDENHKLEEGVKAEGVGFEGVYWNNLHFNSPYHISYFEESIETVNI